MKKLLTLSSLKVHLICGLTLMVTVAGFWHHQVNQNQIDRLSVLNQGIGTCFNRISQTYTAMMIKDVSSPYLNRGFLALSDECLNETIKGINPFKKDMGRGYEFLNQLMSEVHWFHEKVLKVHSPLLVNKEAPVIGIDSLSARFSKMENFKLDLVDEIDAVTTQLRFVQRNGELLMGGGLIIFILSMSLLSLQEFYRNQNKKALELEAANFLSSGKTKLSAVVDELVDRALTSQELNVTAQVFRDYHGMVLESMVTKKIKTPDQTSTVKINPDVEVKEENLSGADLALEVEKTSLKDVLVSIQNVLHEDLIHFNDIRDVHLDISYETFQEMMNAGINQLVSRRNSNKKVMVGNQVHSDKAIINLFLAGNTFHASELEFIQTETSVAADGVDMNLIILKEMIKDSGAQMHLENKVDRNGKITGMNIRFVVKRSPKEKSRLVSFTKGRKKDLAKELRSTH